MKSFALLFSILLLTTADAFADASAKTVDRNLNVSDGNPSLLYDKLVDLFNKSTTPYPLESKVISSRNEVAFKGCTFVSPKGEVERRGNMVVIRYTMTTPPDLGPLQPNKPQEGTVVPLPQESLNTLMERGAFFASGFLRLDQVNVGDGVYPQSECTPALTYRQQWERAISSRSIDGKSFEYKIKCLDDVGTEAKLGFQARLASGYPILKYGDGWYGYCWK